MRPLGRNKKIPEQDLLNLFCLWKQDAAEEVTVLFMVDICFVAYGVFITVQNGAFLMFSLLAWRLWRWILDLSSPIEGKYVTTGSISEAHLHNKYVFLCLDRHFRTSSDNEQMNVIFHMRKTDIWVKRFSFNQFQQIHLCFSMSSINILLHYGGLFTGLQSCLSPRCFMSRYS